MKNGLILLCLFLMIVANVDAGVVKLSGSLKQFGLDRVTMNCDGIAAEVYNDKSIEIVLDTNGRFDLKLKLKHPAYYRVGQNVLYLSPGDELEIVFNRTVALTTFEGRGMVANNYLKNNAKVNAWDVVKIGQKLNPFGLPEKIMPFDVYQSKVDSIVGICLKELECLEGVSPEFRKLEKVRQKASQLCAYLDYFSAGQLSNYDDTPEIKLEKKQAFYRTIMEIVDPLLQEISVSDRYLELPEVRTVLLECDESQVFHFQKSIAFEELKRVLAKAAQLDLGLMQKDYQMFAEFSRQIRNKDLSSSFKAKLQERERLMEGCTAVDIPFKDIDGKEWHLSDFKGKVLYVDFWATWCLPCLFQMPAFEALSEKYPEIQFIGISIDQKEEWWKKKLEKNGIPEHVKEFLADPYVVGEAWDLSSIPRFLLIDEDFKIINAFSPRPSEKEKIEPLLESQIKN